MGEFHVVFGAAGGLGHAIVERLAAEGRPVRAVVRDPERSRADLPPAVEVVRADALDPHSVRRACRDAAVIYHCINVPYHRWSQTMPAATANLLLGAATSRARLVFPGNVYGYGPLQQIPAGEGHPQAATSRKGRLRIALEEQLLAAHRAGDCPVVIPRLPDFYGPYVTNALFAPLFQAGLTGRRAWWAGRLDVAHDLVYTPDAAAACVLLADSPEAYGQVWHVPGAGPVTGAEFIRLIFAAAGRERHQASAMGEWMFRAAGLFMPDAREMVELLYEFEEPLVLDGAKFARAYPEFRFTPHPEAVRQTLDWFSRRRQ